MLNVILALNGHHVIIYNKCVILCFSKFDIVLNKNIKYCINMILCLIYVILCLIDIYYV